VDIRFFQLGSDEAENCTHTELAVSLNSHEAQILNRQGNEWVSSITLSEVSLPMGSFEWYRSSLSAARQADHVYRLGSEFEPHRYLFSG
jgi:hypothetical protein